MTEGCRESAARPRRADEGFVAYETALTRRVALCLRAVAAELDQSHPETETPSERRERATGCLQRLRESEQILGAVAHVDEDPPSGAAA